MDNLQRKIIAVFVIIIEILGFTLASIAFFNTRHASVNASLTATYDLIAILLIVGGILIAFFFIRQKKT